MQPSPWTYRKCQEEELVEEDRVVKSSPRSDGFPDLPEEGKASRQVPGPPPSQTHVELPSSKPFLPAGPAPLIMGSDVCHHSLCPLHTASPPAPLPAETEESQRTQKPPLSGAQHQRRQPACLRLCYFLQQIFTYSQLQSKHIGATEIGDTVPTLKKPTGCERARRQCLYATRQQVPSQEGGQFLGGALTSAKDTGGKGAREVLRRQ